MAGGLLTVLSLHLSGRGPSQGPPGGAQKRVMGAETRGRVWSPMWSGHISGPLSLHLPFVPAEKLQEPGLRAEFTCLRLLRLESVVSHKPSAERNTAQGQREQGALVSPCISLLTGWGLGIMRPESGNGELRLSPVWRLGRAGRTGSHVLPHISLFLPVTSCSFSVERSVDWVVGCLRAESL